MEPFTLPSATPIAFGPGRLGRLAEEIAALGAADAPVLVAADPFVVESGLARRIAESLQSSGHRVELFSEIASDPKEAQIEACAKTVRALGAGVVVALGGGSAMDVGKLAAAVSAGERPVADYALMANPLPRKVPKVLCVPTTSGTGAEVTRTVVFTLANKHKVWAWGDSLKPALALLDPEATLSLPPALTAATGADALVHAIESMTNRRAHVLGDANALQAIRLVSRWLPRAVKDGDDIEARGHMQIAASLAGLAIDVNGTAVAHALGHALGAVGKVHHGRAVALALRVALPENVKVAPERYALVAEAMGLEHVGRKDQALAQTLPAAYDAFLREVGLEIGLKGDGLGPADLDRLVQECMERENRPMIDANIRPLEEKDIRQLFRALLAAQ